MSITKTLMVINFYIFMYSLELTLRYSPFPLSIQKKDYEEVKRIYNEMSKPAFIYDGRNILDIEALRAIGFDAQSIGRPSENEHDS